MKHEAPETSPPLWPVTERPRSAVSSVLLVCGLAGVLLNVARAVFIPIALAILFALLLSSPVGALHRRRFPRSISALLILLIFLSLVGETVNLLWTPAQTWLSAAPRTSQVIQRKIPTCGPNHGAYRYTLQPSGPLGRWKCKRSIGHSAPGACCARF